MSVGSEGISYGPVTAWPGEKFLLKCVRGQGGVTSVLRTPKGGGLRVQLLVQPTRGCTSRGPKFALKISETDKPLVKCESLDLPI